VFVCKVSLLQTNTNQRPEPSWGDEASEVEISSQRRI
jgi:hypothetical protein